MWSLRAGTVVASAGFVVRSSLGRLDIAIICYCGPAVSEGSMLPLVARRV